METVEDLYLDQSTSHIPACPQPGRQAGGPAGGPNVGKKASPGAAQAPRPSAPDVGDAGASSGLIGSAPSRIAR